jgi:hypothetical protein
MTIEETIPKDAFSRKRPSKVDFDELKEKHRSS